MDSPHPTPRFHLRARPLQPLGDLSHSAGSNSGAARRRLRVLRPGDVRVSRSMWANSALGGAHPCDPGKGIYHYAFPSLDTGPHPMRAQSAASARLAPGDHEPRFRCEPPLHLHQGHGAHARAAEGGGRAGGVLKSRMPAAGSGRVSDWSGVGCGPASGGAGIISRFSRILTVSSQFGPGHRLAGRQPAGHGAPPEDFGRAPRSDKGVGDGDTSVTAASGRGGGGGRVAAAGTEARAQRQLCGCSGAGWDASITRCPPGEPQAPHAVPLQAPCPCCRSPARSLRTTGLAATSHSRRRAPPCSRGPPAAQPKCAIGRARRRRQLPPPRSHGDPRQPMQWTLGPCGTPGASTAPAPLHYKYFSKMRRSSLRAPRPPAASALRP